VIGSRTGRGWSDDRGGEGCRSSGGGVHTGGGGGLHHWGTTPVLSKTYQNARGLWPPLGKKKRYFGGDRNTLGGDTGEGTFSYISDVQRIGRL